MSSSIRHFETSLTEIVNSDRSGQANNCSWIFKCLVFTFVVDFGLKTDEKYKLNNSALSAELVAVAPL